MGDMEVTKKTLRGSILAFGAQSCAKLTASGPVAMRVRWTCRLWTSTNGNGYKVVEVPGLVREHRFTAPGAGHW